MIARHGLTEVYAPPEGAETVALIVFVHGLFGHPYHTWAPKTSKSRSKSPRNRSVDLSSSSSRASQSLQSSFESGRVQKDRLGNSIDGPTFWPRDLLPDVIRDVRIFTWGYDADIDGFGSASQSTIHQHAGTLLSDILDQRERAEHYKRPIVFIVHSLGGIIVKAALNRSSATEGTRLKEIAPATCGVCFLGTPHRGSKSASLGRVAYQISVAATRRPNTRLLQGLEKNSETLEQVGDGFAQTMLKSGPSLHIYSFREEKETRKYFVFNTMVVDADSAKIGDAREEVGSIPANHSEMTKFESSDDIGFKRISAQLRRWVQELRGDETISKEDIVNCISSLESVDTKIRIADVRKAHEMTFHWLFDPSIVSFSEWLQNRSEASQPFYWIQGKPGSGKSTLMKFALKDPRTIDLLGRDSELPWTIVAFFFHDRGTSSLQKTLSGLLREVISSILSQLPQLLPLAVEMYRKLVKVHGKRRPEWDLEDLAALMRQIVGQRETRIRLLIFLDALDEHAGDNELLVQMLQEWRTSADGYYVNLKVCLASRPWNIFVEYLSDGPNLAIHHHTENDINVYTNARLRASIRGGLSKLLDPDSCASLTDQITAKAQGVFIWVSLVTDHLAKNIRDGTPYQTLKSMVAAMPEELEDLYEHTVARIDPEYTNETHIIFQMVLHSVEPLTLETLFHASRYTLRLYLHHDATDEVPDVDSDQGLRWLMSRGGGILDLSAGSSDSAPFVQFLHQTAKEYLQSPRARVLMERVSARFAAKTGPYFLALCTRSCAYWVADIKKSMLYYLKLVEIDRQMDVNIQMPIHYESSKSSDQVGCGTLWWLQQQEGPFFEMCKNEYIDRNQEMFPDFSEPMLTRRRYTYSFIVIMVAANLISLVERSLTSEMLNFIRDNMTASGGNELELCLLQVTIGIPSLIPAHLEDRAAMVRTLLSLGHPQDIFTPLRSFLVSEEREVYKPRGNPHTPLEFLVTRGDASPLNEDTRLSIAKMLLERGASVPTGLLHYCAEHDSAAMVRLLLQLGAATNVTDPYGWLPVEYAILRQDRSVLTAFLDHDPSILRVHPSYGAMQWERTLLPPIIPLMAFGHPGLAILLARLKILGLPVLGQEFASKTKQSVVNFDDDNVETQSALPGDVDSNISSHTE